MATPTLLGPAQQCACNAFDNDTFRDHLQTCQTKSAASQVHDCFVYRLGALLGSVGHRVKIHNITSVTNKERGDLEIQDYVVLQKPQTQATRLPPPRTLILDYTILGLGVLICTLWANLRTQGVQIVLLTQMGF